MCEFSLLTVCLNPGEKLRGTLESALMQTYGDFEVLIKDGGSTDGSLEGVSDLLADPRVRVITRKDTGIYDAMNQAVEEVAGKYVFFLNCGDKLYDETVLGKVAEAAKKIAAEGGARVGKATMPDGATEGVAGVDKAAVYDGAAEGGSGATTPRFIFYGNVVWKEKQALITPPSAITGFTCFRNVPCHQACFYDTGLCKEKPFETKYKIRGDYEHFLWCHYVGKASEKYLGFTVAEYEGGGYSESKKNIQRSKQEHREITQKYMGKAELFRYRAIMALTLQPLRTWMAENPKVSGVYHKLVGVIYRRK